MIEATDYFGNASNLEYSDDYFILGNPRGDININYINEEEKRSGQKIITTE